MDKVVALSKFLEINREKHLGTKVIAMYVILLEACDGLNPFQMTDGSLAVEIGCSRNAVSGARKILYSAGLVDYETRRGKACKYTISGFAAPESTKSTEIKDSLQYHTLDTAERKKFATNSQTISSAIRGALKVVGKISQQQSPRIMARANDSPHRDQEIPTLEEFLNYIRNSFKDYQVSMDSIIINKYNMWVANGWRNGMDHPIFNWRGAVRGNWKYWTSLSPTIGAFTDLSKIPNRTLPKITYDED